MGIFFFSPELKTHRENKPTRLHRVPEADRCALTQYWAGSELGIHTREAQAHTGRREQQVCRAEVLGAHVHRRHTSLGWSKRHCLPPKRQGSGVGPRVWVADGSLVGLKGTGAIWGEKYLLVTYVFLDPWVRPSCLMAKQVRCQSVGRESSCPAPLTQLALANCPSVLFCFVSL